MIIKGRSRANADELATHLLRADTNERVEVIEIRGTIAMDVKGALREMCAVAAGSTCKKNLYHGVINVRTTERLDLDQWRFAIDALEKRLGLTGHPRAIIMHEKRSREHVHIVWSRIDPVRMCAISDSWNYRANEEVAREMERTFGHERVQGVHAERSGADRPKRTRSHAEMQQAERTKVDISALSSELTDLWQATESGDAFFEGLKRKGYLLARGDRVQFVIVDHQGGAHSAARRIDGIRPADLRVRLSHIDRKGLPSVERARSVQRERLANANELVANPEAILGVFKDLLRTRSYVTELELSKAFDDHPPAAAIKSVLALPEVIALYDGEQLVGHTTQAIRAEEEAVLAAAKRMASKHRPFTAQSALNDSCANLGLNEEQVAAVRHAVAGAQLSIIVGRAGTAKSTTVNAIRILTERGGLEAVGLGPTNSVVQDLLDGGFNRASTLHSFLWYARHAPDHPKAKINKKTRLIVDEAAVIDTSKLSQLIMLAEQAGGLVLVGDDRHLFSIERRGMFTDIVKEVGAAKLTTVRREVRHWSRRKSEALSQGRFRDGLEAFVDRGLIGWMETVDEARQALLEQYANDTVDRRGRRFVFAYTNEEVLKLNEAIQRVEIGRGRVGDVEEFQTSRCILRVGVGDRIIFRRTDKSRGILNGALATIEKLEDGRLTVRTDIGKPLTVDLRSFDAVELGYSGTIYRGQGKALDEAYVLYSRHCWDAANYVALTRSRGDTRIFVSRDHARDFDDLVRQMSRSTRRSSTLGFSIECAGFAKPIENTLDAHREGAAWDYEPLR